jgi:metallo-beta-lactamase class B
MKPAAARKPRKRIRLLLAVVILLLAGIAIAQTQLADLPAAARHVAAAELLAEPGFTAVAEGFLCKSPVEAGAYLAPYLVSLLSGSDSVQTFQAFDDLYYIGLKFVGTWVLVTGEGLILFDAMFNEQQAKEVVVAGLQQLGLDPKDLKHIIITHAHGDHDGGADYLQREYGARVWLSAIDWDYLEEHRNDPPMKPFGDMWPETLPQRDAVAEDGGMLELGGKSVQFVVTPGHTPGTLSAVIPVDDGGTRRYVTLWGGTAMPEGSAAVLGMHASLLKLWRAGQDAGAEGVISTHAFVEDSFGRSQLAKAEGENPFNLGKDGFNRMMGIHSECILAQAARYQAKGE